MSIKYAHTNIITDDWRKLVDFYQTVFGCTPVPPERDQSGDWLSEGTGVPNASLAGMHLRLPGYGDEGPTLEIYSYGETLEGATEPMANRKGFGHIAFLVDDVLEIVELVISNGGRSLGKVVEKEVPGVGLLTLGLS